MTTSENGTKNSQHNNNITVVLLFKLKLFLLKRERIIMSDTVQQHYLFLAVLPNTYKESYKIN